MKRELENVQVEVMRGAFFPPHRSVFPVVSRIHEASESVGQEPESGPQHLHGPAVSRYESFSGDLLRSGAGCEEARWSCSDSKSAATVFWPAVVAMFMLLWAITLLLLQNLPKT